MQIFLTSEMCSLIGRGEVLCKTGRLGGGGGQGFLIKGAEWGGVGKEQTRSCISLWGKEWGCKKSESGWGMSQSRGREGKKHIWIMLGLLKHVIMSVVLGIKARETHALVSHFDAKVYLFLKHT